jgi:hypothetical protein
MYKIWAEIKDIAKSSPAQTPNPGEPSPRPAPVPTADFPPEAPQLGDFDIKPVCWSSIATKIASFFSWLR